MAVHLRLVHGDVGIDRLPHRGDAQLHRVAFPARGDVGIATRDMLAELVDVAADPALGFLFPKPVGKVNVDGLAHS